MKALILSLTLLSSGYAFADAASDMVQNTFTKGQQILANKSTDMRNQQMCDLVANSADANSIGQVLLGQYDGMASDKAGVALFYQQMPSLAVTELIKQMGNANGASVDVSPDSYDRGDGTFEVDVTANTSKGSYDAAIILDKVNGHYRIVDGTYMGFSGVSYLGGQMQKDIGNESDSQHPVSAYMKQRMADPNYINCN